ncbi:MAG: ATP-binding cassette domain-containing protein [Thermosphaera sp.]
MVDIHKSFGKVVALRGVNFEVEENEVVGLIGDNGAGKSTLIKILSGVFPPTQGEIYIRGEKVDIGTYSVRKAREYGIETVFQDEALGYRQPLWRNLFVGREPTRKMGFLNIRRAIHETDRMMKEYLKFTGGGISPWSIAKSLSGGERQGIAIGRAMYFEAQLVILDEPTRALSVKEIGKVLKFVEELKNRGKACVYISHTIAHVYAISDRFVILDRGQVVGEYRKDAISEAELNAVLARAFRMEGLPHADA